MAWNTMTMIAEVRVSRAVEEVWAFLADPRTAPLWDRSVASVEISPGPVGVSTVVETTAPSGKRQQFRITEFRPTSTLTFTLLRSGLFTRADLSFLLSAEPAGTKVTHRIAVTLQWRALPLYPVIALVQHRALATDLDLLKQALERVPVRR